VSASIAPEFASPVSTSLEELLRLRALAAELSARKRRTVARQQGAAPSRHFGRGLDFAEVREYHAGDEVRMMDWNVTARTGRAHIKVFTEERERPVIFIIDQSASMFFGTRGMFKSAMAVRLSAVLAWCALAAGDRIGAVIARDTQIQRIKPTGQRRGILTLLQALINDEFSTAKDAESGDGVLHNASLAQAVQQARLLASSGSRVVIVSDFQTLDAPLQQHILSLSQRVEITPVCVRDALEESIPERGVLPVRARRGSQAAAILDTGAKAQAAHAERASAARKNLDELFSLTGQSVSYVQSHHSLSDSATHAWFGVSAN